MMMSMLNPNQVQTVNNFKGMPREKQAQIISDVCNEKGITKEQLQGIMDALQRSNFNF